MVTKALLVWLEAQPGKGDAVEDFLVWARLLVEKQTRHQTVVGSAVRRVDIWDHRRVPRRRGAANPFGGTGRPGA